MEKKTQKVRGMVTRLSFEPFSRGEKAKVDVDGRLTLTYTAWKEPEENAPNPADECRRAINSWGLAKNVVGEFEYEEREGGLNPKTGKPYLNRDLVGFKADDKQPTLAASAPVEPAPAQGRTAAPDGIKAEVFDLEKECLARCVKIFEEVLGEKPKTDGDKNIIQTMLGSTFIEINKRC